MKKLSLAEIVDSVPFRMLRWGCRMPTYMAPRLRAHKFLASKVDSFHEVNSNNQWIVDAPEDQTLGACVAHGTCEAIESANVKDHGTKLYFPLDVVNEIYMQSRMEHYHNQLDEGLELPMAAQTMINMEIIPDDTQIKRIGLSWSEINAALDVSGLITGQTVHEGWSPSNLQPENGAVNESSEFTRGLSVGDNGHCIYTFGANVHNGINLCVDRGSWGAIGQRKDCVTCRTITHAMEWMIDFPVQLIFGPKWKTWTAHEKWMKPV